MSSFKHFQSSRTTGAGKDSSFLGALSNLSPSKVTVTHLHRFYSSSIPVAPPLFSPSQSWVPLSVKGSEKGTELQSFLCVRVDMREKRDGCVSEKENADPEDESEE